MRNFMILNFVDSGQWVGWWYLTVFPTDHAVLHKENRACFLRESCRTHLRWNSLEFFTFLQRSLDANCQTVLKKQHVLATNYQRTLSAEHFLMQCHDSHLHKTRFFTSCSGRKFQIVESLKWYHQKSKVYFIWNQFVITNSVTFYIPSLLHD